MADETAAQPKPVVKLDKSKLYGILNETDGTPIRRKVRKLRVSIGQPSGPDVHIWINAYGKWTIGIGEYTGGGGGTKPQRTVRLEKFESQAEARSAYIKERANAQIRKYPIKLGYFTFLVMGPDGDYWHDLDAIGAHGPLPTEVDVVFLMDEPLEAEFKWYSTSKLKCHGDGKNALRRIELAEGEEELKLAQEAKERGEKFFPIIEGCYTMGCPYGNGTATPCAKCDGGNRQGYCDACKGAGHIFKPAVCKPHGRLYFQLKSSPSIGGTNSFDTTGKRSISQLESCLDEVRTATQDLFPPKGRITGIPMTLVVRPYKVTKPDGGGTVQFAVSLEVRGDSATGLFREMLKAASSFKEITAGNAPRAELGPAPADVVAREETGDLGVGYVDLEGARSPEAGEAAEAKAFTAGFTSGEAPEEGDAAGFDVMVEDEDGEDEEGAIDVHDEGEDPENGDTKPKARSLAELTKHLKGGEKQEATPATGTATTESPFQDLFTEQDNEATPLIGAVIHGVQFPVNLLEGPKVRLLIDSIDSELARTGEDAQHYAQLLKIERLSDLNEEGARCLVNALRTLPDKKAVVNEDPTSFEARLAATQYTGDVTRLCNEFTGPASKLGATEKAAIEEACKKRKREINEAKKTNGKHS